MNSRIRCMIFVPFFILIGGVFGQTIHVHPEEGLMDERLTIRVTGLSPEQPAIIRAQAKDIDGRLWQSFAGFYADEKGNIDLSKHAPANGDYSGVDEMGLILWMDLPLNERVGAQFTYRYTEPVITRFSMEVNGVEVDTAIAVRRFTRPDLRIQSVRENGLVGTFFSPAGEGAFPGLIHLGGSEGGLTTEGDAALLASHGYAALALAYFGIEDLPELFEELPIEYFKKAIDWMLSRKSVANDRLCLFGTSKGAEAALITASLYPQVSAVVAYAPSSVVWSTIYGSDKSSWSYQGSPLPCVGPGRDPTYNPPRGYPLCAVINYNYRLNREREVKNAIIAVERIRGPVLLISGKDDQLFPSFTMSEMIMDRFEEKKYPYENKHLAYEHAGHQIRKFYLPMAGSTAVAGGRLVLGGTVEGNIQALRDSWPEVLNFLGEQLMNR